MKPLVIWIWNQNIAISTIVGTSSHIKVSVENFLMICGIALPLTAREITLGISESYIENQTRVEN
jgi:hypothetical protein